MQPVEIALTISAEISTLLKSAVNFCLCSDTDFNADLNSNFKLSSHC